LIPISFEFFPPKTDEQRDTLEKALPKLKSQSPDYVSVTFGAGGSTLSYTPETIRHLRENHALEAAPHISCMGGSREEIRALLKQYRDSGCKRLVALRGDLPSGMATVGEIRYASDLVAFIRNETGDHFHIEVACYPEVHPQSDDAHADLKHFKTKIAAGANGAITQYFYNADAYFHFIDAARKAGIDVPIVPGIMPVSNFQGITRMAGLCGSKVPAWLAEMFAGLDEDVETRRMIAATVAGDLCRRLQAEGVDQFHFYTLNRADLTFATCHLLGVRRHDA